MTSPSIHIMQGRLLPPQRNQVQSFPLASWQDEFKIAREAGIEGIEWIYDGWSSAENPITTKSGQQQIKQLAGKHEVSVCSLCADWFQDYPVFKVSGAAWSERLKKLRWLIQTASDIGIKRVVIPFVDASALDRTTDLSLLERLVNNLTPHLELNGVELHLETDLDPSALGRLMSNVPHPLVMVNYDIGNSAAAGYDPGEEFDSYGDCVGSVHVKDRLLNGGTVPLGSGNADITRVFKILQSRSWQRPLVLQVARGDVGDELAWAEANSHYVRSLWQSVAEPEQVSL